MSYFVYKIELVSGETVEERGFSKIHDGVLTIEPPYSRGGASKHFPLNQVKTWTSEEV
jgi:hypothetical protein